MVNVDQDGKDRLRQEISELGLTNNGFARLCRVSERTIRHWLDDRRGRPIPAYAWAVLDLYKQIKALEDKLLRVNKITHKE